MSEKDFNNLDQFLRANRPEAPAAPANELQAIQERLTPSPRRPFYFRPAIWGSLSTAAAALLVFVYLQRPPAISPSSAPAGDDAGVIVYSAMVDFYDTEESELLSEEIAEMSGFDELN